MTFFVRVTEHASVASWSATWVDRACVRPPAVPQGNMFDFLVSRGGRLSEQEAARVVMRPLMSALAFLHSQHFIHRVSVSLSLRIAVHAQQSFDTRWAARTAITWCVGQRGHRLGDAGSARVSGFCLEI